MEKVVLKSIELENAISKLRSKVVTLQTAVNQAASSEEVLSHYASIKNECAVVSLLLANVRNGCFDVASKYYLEWEQ